MQTNVSACQWKGLNDDIKRKLKVLKQDTPNQVKGMLLVETSFLGILKNSGSIGDDECRVLACSMLVETFKWSVRDIWLRRAVLKGVFAKWCAELLDLAGTCKGLEWFFSKELLGSVGGDSEWAREWKMQGFLFRFEDWRCALPVVKIYCNKM